MADEIRINRSQASAHQQPAARPDSQPQEPTPQKQGGSKTPWIVLAVVVIVIIALGVLFRDRLLKNSGSAAMSSNPEGPSGYQAVFLTNGQVYFGKISNVNGNYVGLSDIFYLQVGPQQGSATGQGQAPAQTNAQQQVSLVKLGNELHGPVDFMHISRSQILFYEDLKNDGQVVKAIEAYKANPSGAAAAQQTPPVVNPSPAQ